MTRLSSQRGQAALTALMLGSLATFMAGALMQHGMVAEKEAVARSLAETRAYWAAMGHISYAMSRISKQGGCREDLYLGNCGPDTSKAGTAQAYLDEISSLRNWTYPDVNSDYYINLSLTAAPAGQGGQTKSGYVSISATFPTSGQSPLPVLNGLSNRLRPVVLIYCTMGDADDPCNAPTNNYTGSQTSPYNRMYRLSRPPVS